MAMWNKQRVSGKQQTLSCDRGFRQIASWAKRTRCVDRWEQRPDCHWWQGAGIQKCHSSWQCRLSGWWFGTFFFSIEQKSQLTSIFFRGVETTNQLYYIYMGVCVCIRSYFGWTPIDTYWGTGVAFAPEPCWVAFAPEWSGMKWVQGRMWPSFRGECDPCFCVAGAIVSEPQKDFFHPRESYSRVMRRSNSHFNQLPGHYGCYGVPLLRCNIHFEQLRRCFGCYVPTAISINFQHAMDATL